MMPIRFMDTVTLQTGEPDVPGNAPSPALPDAAESA